MRAGYAEGRAMTRMLLTAVLIAGLGVSSTAGQSETVTVDVVLADFSFTPSVLRFQHGGHYLLRLSNQGSGGHNFTAPDFFAAVEIDSNDLKDIHKGKVEVPKGSTVDIGFTAVKPGSYRIKCSHFLHSGFGMKGTAVIN